MSPTEKEDDKLIAYFMGQTNERLAAIETKLVELISFRAEILASARTTSVFTGAVAFIAGIIINVLMKKWGLL